MAMALPIVVLDFLLSLVIWSVFERCDLERSEVALRIVHPHQIEPVRRRDRAGGGAVARFKRRFEIGGAPLSLADELQRADHRAHLVVQERARRRLDQRARRRA